MAIRSRAPRAALWASAVWLSLNADALLAHAQFETGVPSAGAVLAESPPAIELVFNEPVEPVGIKVIDASGHDRLEAATAHSTDNRVRVELAVPLEPGAYLLSYRVISGDGHVIASAYGFAIGDAAAASVPAGEPSAGATESAAWLRIIRSLYVIVLLTAIGSALFLAWFDLEHALREWLTTGARTLALAGCILAILYASTTGLAMLGPQSADLAGALRTVAGTSVARSLWVALAGFVMLGLACRRTQPAWLIAAAVVLGVSRLLTGHPASREPAWLLQSAMGLHVASAGFWLASLPLLWKGCAALPCESLARLLERFSRKAVVVVGALALAGLAMALVHLSAPPALIETPYGRLLTWKLLGFAVLLGFAAWHKWRLTPAIERGAPGAVGQLRTSIALEGIVMLAVVVLSTVLASTAPEEEPGPAVAARPDWRPPAVTVESASGAYRLRFEIVHSGTAATGQVDIFAASGEPVRPVALAARASLPTASIGDVELAVNQGAGQPIEVDLAPLAVAGAWLFDVDVFVTDFDKETFEFELDRS